jgi:hypothetical protein
LTAAIVLPALSPWPEGAEVLSLDPEGMRQRNRRNKNELPLKSR